MPICPAMSATKLAAAEQRRAGIRTQRQELWKSSSPKTCCPATSTPISALRGFPPATSRHSPPNCSRSAPRRCRCRTSRRMPSGAWMPITPPRLGRRHVRLRHAAGQRHLAAGTGAEHEVADHLRHHRPRRPRGAGRQPGRDDGRPREAEAHQGAVPRLGLFRSRPHRTAGSHL